MSNESKPPKQNNNNNINKDFKSKLFKKLLKASAGIKMLSKEHKILLAQMIFNERQVLFGDCGPNLSKVEKQEKWVEIFIKLNSMGANIPDYKVPNLSLIT